MVPTSIGQLKARETPLSRFAGVQEIPRRVAHGGVAWAVNRQEINLHQPQDGASDTRGRVTDIGSRLLKIAASEPEDARLTGSTRSLVRRLSGLNLERLTRPIAPKSVAGAGSIAGSLKTANVA